jgi:conserved oligomeric Golgi complex subunit 6
MMSQEDEGVSGAPSASINSHHILSERVARALAVRTDTLAMKTALDALQSSYVPHQSSLDSRSVRTAMEMDTLQQARLVQDSVHSMLQVVTKLRTECEAIRQTAQEIRTTLQTPVVEGEDEADLAARIAEALAQRNRTQARVETLRLFVQQYHLSEDDSALLEQYHFPEVTTAQSEEEAMAFLNALRKVRKIRHDLHQRFGAAGEDALDSSPAGVQLSGKAATTTAFQMMEHLSQLQENAYERMYHWLQHYLQVGSHATTAHETEFGSNSAHSVDDILQNEFVLQVVHTLKFVPAFYNHCIELMASQRRTMVTRKFLLALTVGADDHQPPIEMKAHDSVACTFRNSLPLLNHYCAPHKLIRVFFVSIDVADMLVFVFQSFSLEADMAQSLLSQSPQAVDSSLESMEPRDANVLDTSERRERDEENLEHDLLDSADEKALSAVHMVSISMSGVVRPLKSRIVQVITALSRRNDPGNMDSDDEDGFVPHDPMEDEGAQIRTRVSHLYDIAGLLLFYHSTIQRSIRKLQTSTATRADNAVVEEYEPGSNPLLDCIMECLLECSQGYEATIRVYCAMLDQISIITGDSVATLIHQLLITLIQIRTHSPGYLEDVILECPNTICQHTLSIEWVSEILMDLCLQQNAVTMDDIVTLKQSFLETKRMGFNISDGRKLEDSIMQKEAQLMDELVRMETAHVMDICGLSAMVHGWDHWKDELAAGRTEGRQMSSYTGLTVSDIESGLKDFYASLYAPPIPSMENKVQDPVARKRIRSQIAKAVVTFYWDFYDAHISSSDATPEVRQLFLHTPQEVQTLFSA